MEQIIEFTANHPVLVGILVAILSALVITELMKGGKAISSQEVSHLINKAEALIVDVREKADFDKGHIVNAYHIPHTKIAERMGELNKYQEKPVIVVDAMGQHSGTVSKQLKDSGFTSVLRLRGGVGTWSSDGLPLVKK